MNLGYVQLNTLILHDERWWFRMLNDQELSGCSRATGGGWSGRPDCVTYLTLCSRAGVLKCQLGMRNHE